MIIIIGIFLYLEKLVSVQLYTILEPSYVRSGETLGHAEKGYLPAQHVVQFKVRALDNASPLQIMKQDLADLAVLSITMCRTS